MNKIEQIKTIKDRLNIQDCTIVLFRSLSDFKHIDVMDHLLENDGDGHSKYVYGTLKNSCCGSRKQERVKLGKVMFSSLFFGLCVYIPLLFQGII